MIMHSPKYTLSIWALSLVALLSLFACGKNASQNHDQEFRALAEKQDYKEIEARVELYKKKGEHGASLDYWQGVALLQQDQDIPAKRAFEQAVAADSSLAFDAASQYREAAAQDLKNGWKGRGAHRLEQAYLWDHKPQMGELELDVCRLLFNGQKYRQVIPVLQDLLTRGGESATNQQRWRYLLGRSYEETGFPEAGLAEYQRYWADWHEEPKSVWRDRVSYRSGIILLAQAKDQRERGIPSAALKLLDQVHEMDCEVDQRAEAYYEAGLCYEALGQPEEALKSYRRCLDLPRNAGGNGRDEARKRIVELRASGVH